MVLAPQIVSKGTNGRLRAMVLVIWPALFVLAGLPVAGLAIGLEHIAFNLVVTDRLLYNKGREK